MIQMRTILEVADNSGAKRISCINLRGGSQGRYAELGDVITANVKEASPEGTVNYEYDDLGRKTRTYTGTAASPVSDYRYTYDSLGRLATVEARERNGVVLPSPETTAYQYDLVGNLPLQRQANGTVVAYTYNELYRLDTLTQYAPDATPNDLSDNPKLADFDYTVRADGQRTAVQERRHRRHTGQRLERRGRLVRRLDQAAAALPPDEEMGVGGENLGLQVLGEAGGHGAGDDQGGHPDGNAGNRDQRDDRDEGLLALRDQIAEGDEQLVAHGGLRARPPAG